MDYAIGILIALILVGSTGALVVGLPLTYLVYGPRREKVTDVAIILVTVVAALALAIMALLN